MERIPLYSDYWLFLWLTLKFYSKFVLSINSANFTLTWQVWQRNISHCVPLFLCLNACLCCHWFWLMKAHLLWICPYSCGMIHEGCFVLECVCMCVCVCVREREREWQRACVCVCVWERERERDREHVCVCVRERERERERQWSCVCVCVWTHFSFKVGLCPPLPPLILYTTCTLANSRKQIKTLSLPLNQQDFSLYYLGEGKSNAHLSLSHSLSYWTYRL